MTNYNNDFLTKYNICSVPSLAAFSLNHHEIFPLYGEKESNAGRDNKVEVLRNWKRIQPYIRETSALIGAWKCNFPSTFQEIMTEVTLPSRKDAKLSWKKTRLIFYKNE